MAGCMKTLLGLVPPGTFVVLFMVLLLPQISHQTAVDKSSITHLRDGQEHTKTGANVFCYTNTLVPTWRQTWTRIQVRVWSSSTFKVETAQGEEELQRLSFWGWLQGLLREGHNETTVNIDLFSNRTCFKIDPAEETQYSVKSFRKFDIYLFLICLMGALLFVFADSLSRSEIFFYSSGMSMGIVASLIIVFFILARLLPKKSPFFVLIAGGWSFSIYAIQLVFRNLGVILREHWNVALGYVSVVGFISFAVCYRYGPLVDKRSTNLMSWTLQLVGLLLVYSGIQIQQVSFAIIVAALLSKNVEYPVTLAVAVWRGIQRRVHWKPEPRRLLTEEEYQRQGEEETRRALDELRKLCHSPEFSPWRAVSRLQSPKRFADFIEGSPHLMSNEVSVHTQEYGLGGSYFEGELFDTDDEDEDVKITEFSE